MTTAGSSGSDALLGVVAVTLLVVTYGQWLFRSRRLRRLQERVRSRVAVVRELIADGERTLTAYADASDPLAAHGRFLQRCDSSLREQFGDSFARRIDAYSEFEWIQPASLISDEQVFAWYDTERRLKGLRELLHEALLDLASSDE
ncbi:MAG TPA: hypothetical protein VF962_09805 [Gemmatimonadaceae bacterium]